MGQRKYISLYELLNMVRGIEDLLLEDDNDFLKKRYRHNKRINGRNRRNNHRYGYYQTRRK